MHKRVFLILIAVVIAANILHGFVAALVFRKRKDRAGDNRLSYEEIKRRRKALNSLAICGICFLLPYRVREFFVLTLHFLINSMKAKLLLLVNLLSSLLEKTTALLVYFIGLPMAIFCEKLMSKDTKFVENSVEQSDVTKRY